MKRLTGRRTCSNASCGAIYNIYFTPPKAPGRCDKCGSNLAHRSDDNENTVRSRLQVYEQQTAPLVTYYKAQGKLRTVRGSGSVNEIFKNVTDIIEVQMRPLAAAMSAAATAAAKNGGGGKSAKTAKKAAPAKPAAKPAAKSAAKKAAPKKKPAPKPKKKAAKKAAPKKAKKAVKKKAAPTAKKKK